MIKILMVIFCAALAMASGAEPERIPLWNGKAPTGEGQFEKADAFVTVHLPEKPNGVAMIICPGGGYGMLVTGAEGHGIAKWLNGHGIAGIVLEYRLPAGRPFVPLLDAQRAIRLTRSRAIEWKIDPKRTGIIGFSAGGHLASTAGTHFDEGNADSDDAVAKMSSRPDFMILIYPVITMEIATHGGSRKKLLGDNADPSLMEMFSNELHVTAECPPTFLAHAIDDKAVTIENSRMFYQALRANDVAAELLELPDGGHGLNGYKGPSWDAWQKGSLTWLTKREILRP
jgi:acetyl esterase/lipase